MHEGSSTDSSQPSFNIYYNIMYYYPSPESDPYQSPHPTDATWAFISSIHEQGGLRWQVASMLDNID
jgi:hypothetical protein